MSRNASSIPREVDDDGSASPFAVPAVSSGYPLESREEEAIDRVIGEGLREQNEAGGDQEAA